MATARRKTRKRLVLVAGYCLLICLAVAAACIQLQPMLEQQERADDYEESIQNAHVEANMGEWITLDSAAAMIVDPAGGADSAFSDWEGSMRVRVDSATLYSSPDDAPLQKKGACTMPSKEDWKSYREDGGSFLLCQIEIENVDAVSTDEDYPDCYFSTTFLHNFDTQYERCEDASAWNDDGYFKLKKGETERFWFGYMLDGADEASQLTFDPEGVSSYKLNVVDKRGE